MKCPECVAEGKKSRVTVGMGYQTAMYCAPFYDEEGRFHNHDPNATTTGYTCSNGHRWQETTRSRCWCEKEREEGDTR